MILITQTFRLQRKVTLFLLLIATLPFQLVAENGYDLCLHCRLIDDNAVRSAYLEQLPAYSLTESTSTADIIRDELERAFTGLLGEGVPESRDLTAGGLQFILADMVPNNLPIDISVLSTDGFIIKSTEGGIIVCSRTQVGL